MNRFTFVVFLMFAPGCGGAEFTAFDRAPGDAAGDAGPSQGTGGSFHGTGGSSQETGGSFHAGGTPSATGGMRATGGVSQAAGGALVTGGATGSGGVPETATGGAPSTGGLSATGGAPTECTPTTTRCQSATAMQTCDSSGSWGVSVVCPVSCVSPYMGCCYAGGCNCVSSAALCGH